jgi:hypothetical protein
MEEREMEEADNEGAATARGQDTTQEVLRSKRLRRRG